MLTGLTKSNIAQQCARVSSGAQVADIYCNKTHITLPLKPAPQNDSLLVPEEEFSHVHDFNI